MIEFKKEIDEIFVIDGDSVRIKREAIIDLKKPVIDKENYVRKAIYTKEEAIKKMVRYFKAEIKPKNLKEKEYFN